LPLFLGATGVSGTTGNLRRIDPSEEEDELEEDDDELEKDSSLTDLLSWGGVRAAEAKRKRTGDKVFVS
jgi:hypothetical protein